MKLFLVTLLLATIATYGYAQFTPDTLKARWNMDEPEISYSSDDNKFTLNFPTASTDNDPLDGGLQEEFYDVNCKDDGSGFPERVLPTGQVKHPTTGGRPEMTMNGPNGVPQLEFVVDTQAMANNQYVYEIVGESDNTCFGQQYNITMNVSIGVDIDVDIFGGDIVWRVEDKDGNVVFEGPSYGEYHVSIPENNPGTVITEVPDLCRGVDYFFKYIDIYGDGLYQNGSVEGYYMDDLLFKETGSTIGFGFNSTFNLPPNPQNPATNIQGKDGLGMAKFCVRSSLGYAGSTDPSLSLVDQFLYGFQEVNFIESLITIFYDLTAGFDVVDFNVDPKERVETTAAKETYGLEAWLCVAGSNPNTDYDEETWDLGADAYARVAPKAIDSNYLVTSATPLYFNQGALITVCVAPVKEAWADGIRMDGITDFEWLRSDLATTAPGLSDTSDIKQDAIVGGDQAPNLLTSYDPNLCEGAKHFCRFSSILFADFYVSTGAVGGSGNAKLVFGPNGSRRLGESVSRQLQEDEGGESPFDLQVPVDFTDTGPAGLKTAAGVSFAASTFTMAVAVALVGAALLA